MIYVQSIKSAVLPVAFIIGIVFYKYMNMVTFLSPYLLFAMLFFTYCRLDLKKMRLGRFEWTMLTAQMALAALCYFGLLCIDHTVAEGVFLCVYIPTATAAPVITAMLGGSIARVASYSLLCNVFVALTGPVILAIIGDNADMSFAKSFGLITMKVFPLLIGPIVGAWALKRFFKKAHQKIVDNQSISFYLWAVALIIIVGSCVSFVINNWKPELTFNMSLLALGALFACLIQFKTGRFIGSRFAETVTGGQSMGQKNTVLAVWLAMTYMNPVSSIAPAAYIAWQNIINSWQLIRHNSHHKDHILKTKV